MNRVLTEIARRELGPAASQEEIEAMVRTFELLLSYYQQPLKLKVLGPDDLLSFEGRDE